MHARVLSGIRVVEVGSFITAPYAAMLLGDLGADVIKVERPASPDPFRAFEGGAASPHFEAHNRNKRSLALDYTSAQGREALDQLLAGADVLVLNMRPGAEQKLGLAFERVHALNPGLVHCAITGFGRDGPYAGRPAFDNVGQALSGWLAMTHLGDDPRVAGPAVSDTVTGLFAALGIVAAIVERQATGVGRRVEVNMLEATMALGGGAIGQYLACGQAPTAYSRAAASQSFAFECSDGKRIAIHLSSPEKFWTSLVEVVGLPELAARYATRADRVARYRELGEDLQAAFRQRPRSHWAQALERHDVPFAPLLEITELQADAQVRHLGSFGTALHAVHGAQTILNRPWRYDADNFTAYRGAPSLGEHTAELLEELGMSPEAVDGLRSSGVVR